MLGSLYIAYDYCLELSGGTRCPVDAARRIEGHVRVTAYALSAHATTAEVDVLLGTSPAMAGWCLYDEPSPAS